jgi:hypothetical protein
VTINNWEATLSTHALLAISSATALAILSAILPAQAQDRRPTQQPQANAPLATTDPLKTIYRVSGLTDSGNVANVGVATTFHCTSFSTVPETIKFFIRRFDGAKVADIKRNLTAFGATHTASTHGINLFFDDTLLAPGIAIEQGSAVIQSTSLNVHCSAMIVDAASAAPQGIALHMVRLNPVPGTQE